MAGNVDVRRLPREAGKVGRKISRVLAGAGADLEHQAGFRQFALQHRQYRCAVALAGLGKLHPRIGAGGVGIKTGGRLGHAWKARSADGSVQAKPTPSKGCRRPTRYVTEKP